jgi:hypothetical protein
MNKRKFARVLSLYKDGASTETCFASIINMSRTETEAGHWCSRLHLQMVSGMTKELGRISEDRRLTASELTEAKNYITLLETERKEKSLNELSDSKEPANLADQRPNQD